LQDHVARLEARLRHQHPALKVARRQKHLQHLRMLAGAAAARNVATASARLEQSSARLMALSPLQVLERGYALVYLASEGRLLRDAAEAPVGAEIVARLAQGQVRARVEGSE
jgi:exodeoxyribonuclease VII large subunit